MRLSRGTRAGAEAVGGRITACGDDRLRRLRVIHADRRHAALAGGASRGTARSRGRSEPRPGGGLRRGRRPECRTARIDLPARPGSAERGLPLAEFARSRTTPDPRPLRVHCDDERARACAGSAAYAHARGRRDERLAAADRRDPFASWTPSGRRAASAGCSRRGSPSAASTVCAVGSRHRRTRAGHAELIGEPLRSASTAVLRGPFSPPLARFGSASITDEEKLTLFTLLPRRQRRCAPSPR
jgi:hypothetical protein